MPDFEFFSCYSDYSMDLLKLTALTTTHDAIKAGAEVVKQVESPLLSSLVYPCMQVRVKRVCLFFTSFIAGTRRAVPGM